MLALPGDDSGSLTSEVEIEGVTDEESLTMGADVDAVDMNVFFLKRFLEKARTACFVG